MLCYVIRRGETEIWQKPIKALCDEILKRSFGGIGELGVVLQKGLKGINHFALDQNRSALSKQKLTEPSVSINQAICFFISSLGSKIFPIDIIWLID